MIIWRDAMSVGAPTLDNDHKKLIDLINLTEQWVGQDNWRQVATVTDELLRYVDEHFRREEAVMAAIKYPELEQHKKVHETLTHKVRLLSDKFKGATQEEELKIGSQVLIRVLTDWLMTHILKEDMKYKAFIPRKAAPPPAPAQAIEMYSGLPPKTDDEAERKARREARNKDIEYELPPNLAHLLKRLEYDVPELPEPAKGLESFEKLCEAAIGRRIDKVLVFFHRRNPTLQRELPPFFLASPEFAEKFKAAVTKLIFPTIWESRNIRMLSTSYEWAEDDAESFWEHVTKPLEDSILQGWNAGWDDLKLVETKKPDGTRVFQVKDNTKALREMLAPSTPQAYDIPKIGNREIETFRSLLDPRNDWWKRLNHAWRICHDLYEQEKDPRIFQQKAREGALRDNLLGAFARFPPEWGDFLVLACHRVFPRVSTAFLESFVCNFGTTEAQREAHVPYTVRYLRQVKEEPDIWLRERNAEQEWQAQMKELSNFLAHREAEEVEKRR
jgi:hemerythrin-like metal-binding protein